MRNLFLTISFFIVQRQSTGMIFPVKGICIFRQPKFAKILQLQNQSL